jgi:RHS repeat-associated protein
VRRLRASGGADLGGYRYEPWGKHVAADAGTPAPAVQQPLRWKARPWSAFGGPSGTYDMRARVWSPDLGTFLSIDGLQYHDSTSTLFGWPGQNPLKFSDPSGHYRDDTNDNPVQDLVKGGLLPPGLLVMAKGFSLRAEGISMMSSEATFERGDALRRCGSQLLALGGQITGTDAEVLVGAASMIPGVVKSVEGVAEAIAERSATTQRTTVIGRMHDLKKFADQTHIDTWAKSGPGPLPGRNLVTWTQNRAWLEERIARGDRFAIATDPSSLPPTMNGRIEGVPNGYYTARELEYLRAQGIEPMLMLDP